MLLSVSCIHMLLSSTKENDENCMYSHKVVFNFKTFLAHKA